jgi:hypothetical protein
MKLRVGRDVIPASHNHANAMKHIFSKSALALASLLASCMLFAQVGTAVKQSGKAVAQKTEQVGDQARASMSSEPNRSKYKAKAMVHKAKAHYHAKRAKHAAKKIPH